MKVSGIFKTLIVIVACVVLGAFALNIIMPNATKSLVNATEDMIFNATGMQFDFNGDKDFGGATDENTQYTGAEQNKDNTSGNVKGFGTQKQ